MSTYDEVARRWRENIFGAGKRSLNNARMIDRGDRIFSYGEHFELARVIRDKGKPVLFLLNGDRYSVTTSRHQEVIRSAIAFSPLPSVTIPYSVLESAGIVKDSVRLLGVTSDRNVPTYHEARNRDEVPKHSTIREVDDERYPGRHDYGVFLHDGVYRWTTYRHWLGESVIEADVPYSVRCRAYVPARHTLPAPVRPSLPWPATPEDIAAYDAEMDAFRPLLKAYRDSFIEASCPRHGWRCNGRISKVRRAKYLSGFDHNETRASYFFCELPKTDATTVDEAYAALKPNAVRTAEGMGREVKRQGDIFAIPVAVTKRDLTKAGAVFTRRGNVFATNHQATELAVLPDGTHVARGSLRHVPDFRAPDHARVGLGKTFHVLVKNTVPLSA